jgi:CheY-like chemotaxis protein
LLKPCPALNVTVMTSVNAQTILLADDDENDVFFLERAFKQAQIINPVQRAKDGENAIEYLGGEGIYADRAKYPLPCIMLLDLKMPKKNGFEVIEWVRAQPGLKRLPIVVLTSSREDPDVNRAYELGANTYLVKPVKFEGLVEMMRALNLYWLVLAEKPSLQS